MILGIDPGARRIGVAAADVETRFARPVEVIDVEKTDAIARIEQIVSELGVTEVVVGRPVALSGKPGAAVESQRGLLARLRAALDVEVREYDERLTTVVAEQGLRGSGVPSRARKELRDAVAAQVMLQGYMDATR
jgi:putative holliday junction resolvase